MVRISIGADARAALGLFALVFVGHSLSPNATSSDSHWIVPQMRTLLAHGTTDLARYPDLLRQHRYNGIDCVDADYRVASPDPQRGCAPGSRYYVHFPFGPAVAALAPMVAMDAVLRVAGPPVLALAGSRLPPVVRAFAARDYVAAYGLVEMVLASFLIAAATSVVFLTARRFLSRPMAVFLALLFAFATPAWSTGSRALWQHGPEMLMFALAVFVLVQAAARPSLVVWSAVPLAFACFIRPTGGIALVVLAFYVFFEYRRHFLAWALAAAATVTPFLAYDFALYRRLLQPYFTQQSFLAPVPANAGRILTAMAGQLVSPSRGLFVFTPFLVFALAGMVIAFRRRWQMPLAGYLAAILLLHWIAISAFADWTAGYCFGPRYFSDVTPLFLFFLIPVLAAFERGRVPRLVTAVFAAAVLAAFTIHLRGAVNWDVERWNDPDVNPARAWDWKDPQFLRGLPGFRPSGASRQSP